MSTSFSTRSDVYNSEHGQFISREHQRLAEILSDYGNHFSLAFIPEKDLQPGDKPFAILHWTAEAGSYVVRYLSTDEMKNPEAVLGWVFENDTTKNDVLGQMEAHERAREIMKLKRQEDEFEERLDFARSLAGSKLHTFKHNGTTFRK